MDLVVVEETLKILVMVVVVAFAIRSLLKLAFLFLDDDGYDDRQFENDFDEDGFRLGEYDWKEKVKSGVDSSGVFSGITAKSRCEYCGMSKCGCGASQ